MVQQSEGTRVLLLSEKKDAFSELKTTFDSLGCLSQVVVDARDVQVPLRKKAFDLICVDYGLAQSQKLCLQSLRENQERLWILVVVSQEIYNREDFCRWQYLEWGYDDLLVSPILRESLNDVLRRLEKKMETVQLDQKTWSLLSTRQDGVHYYQSFARELVKFRRESLQLLAGYDSHLLNSLARKFTERAREAGFVSMADRVQKLDQPLARGAALRQWKNVIHECDQLEQQIQYFLKSEGA